MEKFAAAFKDSVTPKKIKTPKTKDKSDKSPKGSSKRGRGNSLESKSREASLIKTPPKQSEDPLAAFMNRIETEKKQAEEQKKEERRQLKRKMYGRKAQKTLRLVVKPQISIMAQAMRFWFIKSLKRALVCGDIKSKYLFKFELCDVISPKCYVVKPKSRPVQSESACHDKFIFKHLDTESVQIFCGTSTPTAAQVNSIIDPWINLVPKTPHIVTAYEVYKDLSFFTQLTEFAEGYDNVYNRLKQASFGLLQEAIPRQLIRMVYLFIIQISHAFSYAHQSDLTHGMFDLSQVILDQSRTTFKILNFRPWLMVGKQYQILDKCESDERDLLSMADRRKLAKGRDLYKFGEALYDLMLNKSNKLEKVQQKVVIDSGKNETFADARALNASGSSQTLSQRKKSQKEPQKQEQNEIMPVMETIPLAWVQITEGACIIDILHTCMLIDTDRDTVKLFNYINMQATEQYQKYFDSNFKPLPLASSVTDEYMNYFRMACLNNRAVMTQFKIMSHDLNKQVSELENQVIIDFQESLFRYCVSIDPTSEEANANLILLLWRQGKLFDDQVCDIFYEKIEERSTALLLIYLFRKANQYQIDPTWEQAILNIEPSDGLATYLLRHVNKITAQERHEKLQVLTSQTLDQRQTGGLKSMMSHVSTCVPIPGQTNIKTPSGGQKLLTQKTLLGKEGDISNQEIKRISFSKNERFMVLVTKTKVSVVEIHSNKFELVQQLDLPQQIDYKTADANTLREIQLSKTQPKLLEEIKDTQIITNQAEIEPIIEGNFPEGALRSPQTNQVELLHVIESEMHQYNTTSPLSQKRATSALTATDSLVDDDNLLHASTEEGALNIRKRKVQIKTEDVEENEEKKQERLKQREQECIGGGFNNSEWLAAIDDAGQILCLHSSESVQLIPGQKDEEDFSRQESSKTGNLADEAYYNDEPEMILVSELHVYSGVNFSSHIKLQIGHLCPDEILDLELDNINENYDRECLETNSNHRSDLNLQDLNKEVFLAASKPGDLNHISAIQEAESPRFAPVSNETSPIKTNRLNIGLMNSENQKSQGDNYTVEHSDAHFGILSQSHGSQKMFQLGQSVEVVEDLTKIKPESVGDQSMATDAVGGLKFGSVLLTEPNQLNDSARFLHSQKGSKKKLANLCGLNQTINIKCKNMMGYDLAFATDQQQQALNQLPTVILTGQPSVLPGGATIPTALFRNPQMTSLVEDSPLSKLTTEERTQLLGYKALHYEHMREWIAYQELKGNTIKFSQLESTYCIGFQRTHYQNMKPHFFVYDILCRKVIRRFLPMLDEFKQEWADAAPEEIIISNTGYDNGKNKQYTSADEDSNADNQSTGDGTTDDFEDVSVFEVSPRGNYLVALVSQEFLALKMLPRSMHQKFSKTLTPSFMVQEHIPMMTEDELYDSPSKALKSSTSSLYQVDNNNLRKEVDQDENVFMVSGGVNSSQSSDISSKPIAEQLVHAYTAFDEFVGSSYYKHLRLYKYHKTLELALQDPSSLIYPQVTMNLSISENQSRTTETIVDDTSQQVLIQANVQILPKILRKVLQAIKEYNFTFSVLTPQTQVLQTTSAANNTLSKKTGVIAIKKLCVFDQIIFGRPDDTVKQLIFSSFPRNWKVAAYIRRTLQVYDQITGQQIFELVCPSARKISFIDNENLIVVLEGLSQVYVCSINSQRQAFLNREIQGKRGDPVQVQAYEENQSYNQYTIGLSRMRQDHLQRGKYSDQSEASDNEDETIGIQVIVFDEVIRQMVTSRNIAPFGYIGLIGDTKLSIFLAYAEEDSCTYDRVWNISFWDLRKLDLGQRIELLDFSPNCEEFVAISNTGALSIWSIKKMKFLRRICQLRKGKETPITQLRTFKKNQMCAAFSQPNNLLMLIDLLNPLNITRIRPEVEGFGKLVSFEIDYSELFLICTFSCNKIGIYNMFNGNLAYQLEEPGIQSAGAFIDEVGCFITMLDETKTKANIYVIDWKYEVEELGPRNGHMTTIDSLDDGVSEKGEQTLVVKGRKGLQSQLSLKHKGTSNLDYKKATSNFFSKSAIPQKISNQEKLASAKRRKSMAIDRIRGKIPIETEKSKVCTIF